MPTQNEGRVDADSDQGVWTSAYGRPYGRRVVRADSRRGLLHGQRGGSGSGPAADRCPPVRRPQRVGRRPARAADENAFLDTHSWKDYAAWHLALTDGANDETKARYAFVYGDFRRLHRMGLVACLYRAAEWEHKEVELAAHDLLQHLDNARSRSRSRSRAR